jgi:cell division septal protein FtsQ
MKKRILIAAVLFIMFSTITLQHRIIISKFNLQEIIIENNILLLDKDIKKLLEPLYNKNLLFLKNKDIEKVLMQSSLIRGFKVKKKYPNTLKIKIFEKKLIAILIKKKGKFYLSKNIDLIEFKKLSNFQNLPFVFGNEKQFKVFYKDLNKIKFPLDQITKYELFDTNRWDLETFDKKIIRLPSKNYIKSLENYLEIKNKSNFKKYKVFDYRINNQLILN